MPLRWIAVVSGAGFATVLVLAPGSVFLVTIGVIFALMVLAGVSTARRNRRGVPPDWYSTKRDADRAIEAESKRATYEGL